MIRINQIILPIDHSEDELINEIYRILNIKKESLISYEILKKSIDARKKPELFYSYSIIVKCRNENKLRRSKSSKWEYYEEKPYQFPKSGNLELKERPIIIGAGPAGLFCAYYLAERGYRPILFERGDDVDTREKIIRNLWENAILDTESNVSFGEGGAGTFSDGKLNTLVKDTYGRNREVLRKFVEFGAQKEILYENKPHIGTDILKDVVKNMRNEIIRLGGDVRFRSKLTDIEIRENKISRICINDAIWYESPILVLATGHSARDTFRMLYARKIPMKAKDFAIGFRVEHPQPLINENQYGKGHSDLAAAAYKLTYNKDSRGVYSFCMCPGGYVVNASTQDKMLAVNGMSYSKRDGDNANSAIIVTITDKDYGKDHPLAAIDFQERIENKAYLVANGAVPVERFADFYKAVTNQEYVYENKTGDFENISAYFKGFKPNIKGIFQFSAVHDILPNELNQIFIDAMKYYETKIPGFSFQDVLVEGIESRTSSPVRIERTEQRESLIEGIYPCGEGAGYAGGIMSAAMDGIGTAEMIAGKYRAKIQ